MYNNADLIKLPNGKTMTYNEGIEALCGTRDIDEYLDFLCALKNKFLVILSVKDTPGHKMSEQTFDKIRSIGFSALTRYSWRTYIGVIDHGEVIFNKSGDKAEVPTEYSGKIGELDLFVTSKAYRQGNLSEIIINGVDYSLNSRGWNIVVYDTEANAVIDSVTYDSHPAIATFYHMDFTFDKSYFNAHFFIRDKYKSDWIETYRKNYFSNRKLGCRDINKGIVEPVKEIDGRTCGGVCNEKFDFVAGHIKKMGAGPYNECSNSYRVSENEMTFLDETVIWGGIMINHPGHLIVDSIEERLWWVILHPECTYRIAVVTWVWGGKSATFIKEFMDVLNIPPERLLIIDKPTQFAKIIVPDQSHILLKLDIPYENTREFSLVFEYMRKTVKPSSFKKVYLTKTRTNKQNILGEDYFINFYRNKGFEIVDPQDYTIKEKAGILLGADEVVSTLGTNTLYAVFCKPTVKLTILTRIAAESQTTQVMVNQISGIKDVTIVNVASDFMHRNFVRGLSIMCVTNEFIDYVKKVYEEEVDMTPEESLKNILFDYLKFFPEYYSAPRPFDTIKNQKILTVLQNMSEVFLGKEFDTSDLNLTTKEDLLRDEVKKLTGEAAEIKAHIAELEKSETYTIAKLIETALGNLGKQMIDLKNAFIDLKRTQDETNELSKTITALEKKLSQSMHECERLERENKELHARLNEPDTDRHNG